MFRYANPDQLPRAVLYVFSCPGRYGKPIKTARKFLTQMRLPSGTKYALLTTEMAPKPDPKTGKLPTEEQSARWQRVRPIMRELLQANGLVEIAEEKIFVKDIRGPLEDGWAMKVEAFAAKLCVLELHVA